MKQQFIPQYDMGAAPMPFGRFKGRPVASVFLTDRRYYWWLALNSHDATLRQLLVDYAAFRGVRPPRPRKPRKVLPEARQGQLAGFDYR